MAQPGDNRSQSVFGTATGADYRPDLGPEKGRYVNAYCKENLMSGLHTGVPNKQVSIGAPVRKIVPGYGRFSLPGHAFSRKMQTHVPFESLLEADLIVLHEVNPDVISFGAQPETFRWSDHGKQRRYTPDFKVHLRCGASVFREVKMECWLRRNPTFNGRLERIKAECRARHAEFEIWTEHDVRREPRYGNARLILRCSDGLDDMIALTSTWEVLASAETMSLDEIISRTGLGDRAFAAAVSLVRLGYALIDWDAPLNLQTLLSPVGGAR